MERVQNGVWGDHAVVMEVSCNEEMMMRRRMVLMIEMMISATYHHTYHYHYHLYQINSYIQLLICTQQHLLYITIITIFITICCRVGDGGSIYLQCDRKCMSTYMH